MKKIILLILLLVMMATSCACNKNSSSIDDKNNRKDSQESAEDGVYEVEHLKVKNTVFYNENDVKMTITSASRYHSGAVSFELIIENNSPNNLSFYSNYLEVNGLTVSCLFCEDVKAGETISSEIYFYENDMNLANIQKILTVNDGDFVMNVEVEQGVYLPNFINFSIEIEEENYVQPINAAGKKFYDGYGLEVYYIGSAEKEAGYPYPGKYVYFYGKNTSDKDIDLRFEITSINGKKVNNYVIFTKFLRNTSGFNTCEINYERLGFEFEGEITEMICTLQIRDYTDTTLLKDLSTESNIIIKS